MEVSIWYKSLIFLAWASVIFFSISVMFYKFFVVVSLAFSFSAAKRQGGLKISNWRTFIDHDFCFLNPDHQFFVHENCDQYYECDENNVLHEGWCPDEKPVFDANEFLCGNFAQIFHDKIFLKG